jgi:uncharacterized membrane protein YphA (DoxX/SURF4 family)
MKILALVARLLMGLAFLVFGLNGFFHFIPMGPLPAGPAGAFMGAMFVTHYIFPISFLEGLCGILFLFGRYVPLALTLICPVIVNILMYHAFMDPKGILPGLLVMICWLIVYWHHRSAFKGIFVQKYAD